MHFAFHSPVRAPLAIALILTITCGTALAGPREDVTAAMEKLLAAKSWHATMDLEGPHSMSNQLDYVAPDRFRIKMGDMGTQYIIGNTMIVNVQGQSMRMPVPKGTLDQYRDPGKFKANNATMTAQALGNDLLAGKPAAKYRVRNPKDGTDALMWIAGNGYPAQVKVDGKTQGQATTTTIRYSRFNDPTIKVSAP